MRKPRIVFTVFISWTSLKPEHAERGEHEDADPRAEISAVQCNPELEDHGPQSHWREGSFAAGPEESR